VLSAIGIAVLVSLVAGLYPASRAARLNPVEALRYE
jgi:putative ABC transport system permease protein